VRAERGVIAVVGAVQFVNILDFIMVMPLGPDFARALAIETSHLGFIGGSYTAAGCVAGLAGLLFLDRFSRRNALVVCLAGLVVGTALGAFATDLRSLMLARVIAGLFGGPATSLALAIIADVVPPARRGQAMGAVMGAFSVASVVGVPFGLERARGRLARPVLRRRGARRVVATIGARALLPPLDDHLRGARTAPVAADTLSALRGLLSRAPTQLAFALIARTNLSSFLFVPNIAALVQHNLGDPRERLLVLYLVGGAISFFTMRAAGRLVDRLGALRLIAGCVVSFSVVLVGVLESRAVPLVAIFALFMVTQSARNVSLGEADCPLTECGARSCHRWLAVQ
jgi:predicted MFS family arabinose efflux permease